MNATKLSAILVATLVTTFAGRAAAQGLNVAATPAGTHVLSSSVGMENAFVASLGYAHGLQVGDRTLFLGADFTLPWAKPDLGDYRLRARGILPIVGSSGWRLLGEVMPGVRSGQNPLNRHTAIGLEGNLLGGYYGQRWFAAAELGGDWTALSYIEHTDRFRNTAYAEVKDGWYGTTGATVHAGLVGGYSFEAIDVVLRAGQQRDLGLETLMLPLYLSLGVNARLPF